MIDLVKLRETSEEVIALLSKKDPHFNARLLLDLDKQVRSLQLNVEQLRAKKNQLVASAKNGNITEAYKIEVKQLNAELSAQEKNLEAAQEEFKQLYMRAPNIPDADLAAGGKEANQVVETWGEKPTFNFPIKNHVELATAAEWIDLQAAAKIATSGFVVYRKQGLKLLYKLIQFMLKHNESYGYEPILPPYVANEKSLEIASNFPKFRDQVYEIEKDNLFLIPTAEVSIANLYRDTILSQEELPLRYTAWTSCFRREAGGYGATERGLIRIHQFEKVELYTYCTPENSPAELERMVECATSLLKKLNLHYRVSLLAGQDCSFPSARTYDIEVWMPGQNAYFEVSSCSNCTDFQARRAGTRYRKTESGKPNLVHTLNGSSLALPRLMVALIETYQKADGTIDTQFIDLIE